MNCPIVRRASRNACCMSGLFVGTVIPRSAGVFFAIPPHESRMQLDDALGGPGLQLDDVSFRVGDVAHRHGRSICNLQAHNFADGVPPGSQNSLLGRWDILDNECNMPKAWPVRSGFAATFENVVVQNLQSGTVLPAARQAQMDAAQMCARNAGPRFDLRAMDV